ncbi:MAG TPA: hypothetical protein VGE97_09475 [Nitrososphaera sp.]|jgi:hypothetical protein
MDKGALMTEQEFITQAKLDWEDSEINDIEDALEACYQNGSYDDIGGDVEAPTGHYYKIDQWIVVTDNQGFHKITEWPTVEDAEKHFDELEKEYEKWNNN